MGKASALQNYQKLFNNCSRFDLATSVHVFYSKKRFSNFKRPARKQRLLCGRKIVPIQDWGKVALFLKIGNRTLILILRNVAYISGFSLNLVLLAVLEDQGFIWHYRLGKISNKKSQIIGSTVRQGKNYEIGNSISIGIVLVTLNTSKLRLRYVISVKKNKKNCLLYGFSIEMLKSSPSVLVDKNSSRTHNHLYAIASPKTWHCPTFGIAKWDILGR